MNFELSEEQTLLAETIKRFVARLDDRPAPATAKVASAEASAQSAL